MGKKLVTVDKHLIVDIFKISNKGWKKQKQANKQTVEAMLQHIALPRAYVKIEHWSVGEMKPPYDIRLFALIQVIYQKDNVYYFSNKKCNINHDICARKGSRLSRHFV